MKKIISFNLNQMLAIQLNLIAWLFLCSVNLQAQATNYCIPTTTNGCSLGDHITNVTFNSINNTTGTCISGGSFSDYTSISTILIPGNTYTFSMSVANGGTEYGGVWIDYNQSGTFDVSEFTTIPLTLSGGTWTGNAAITIPMSAILGTTRMSVRSSSSVPITAGSSCGIYISGEGELYTLQFSNCIPPPPPILACYETATFNTSTCVWDITGTPIYNTTTATACDSYTWAVNGTTYTSSGTYTATGNCSVEILNLTINYATSNSISATACDSYIWSADANTYTSSGTYTASSTNIAGCSQTDILNLTIHNSTTSTLNITQTTPYTWTCNGQTYTSSGTYICNGVNAAGCIHTETLILNNYSMDSVAVFVRDSLLNGSLSGVELWFSETPLPSTVQAHDVDTLLPAINLPYANTWVVMVNPQTKITFGSIISWYFIDADNYVNHQAINNKKYPPILTSGTYLHDFSPKEFLLYGGDPLIGPMVTGNSTSLYPTPNPCLHAVLIAGSDNVDIFHENIKKGNNLKTAYEMLRLSGYPANQIYTYYACGQALDLDNADEDNNDNTGSDVTGSASDKNVIMTKISSLNTSLLPSDKLFIYMNGGSNCGTYSFVGPKFYYTGDAVSYSDLSNWTLNSNVGKINFFFEDVIDYSYIQLLTTGNHLNTTVHGWLDYPFGNEPLINLWANTSHATFNSDPIAPCMQTINDVRNSIYNDGIELAFGEGSVGNGNHTLCSCGDAPEDVLWMKDTPNDLGNVPSSGEIWVSPDIWVNRHPQVYPESPVHQNPAIGFGYANYVHVMVRNRSSQSSTPTTVKVYWAKSSTGQAWPQPWDGTANTATMKLGDDIGTINIPSIPAGASRYFSIPWNNVPNPDAYATMKEPGHFCLLARIQPVNIVESENLYENISTSNKISMRNVNIVNYDVAVSSDPGYSALKTEGTHVSNYTNTVALSTLSFVVPSNELANSIYTYATIQVKLDPALYSLWAAGGKQGANITELTDSSIALMGSGAYLSNISLPANSNFLLQARCSVNTMQTLPSNPNFNLDIIQKNNTSNKIVGGVRMHFNHCFFNPLSIVASSMTNVTCHGGADGSILVSTNNGTSPYTYSWVDNMDGATRSNLAAGTYTVLVRDANDCEANKTILITEPAPITVTAPNVSSCSGSPAYLGGSPTGGIWSLPNPYTGPSTSYTYFYTDANGCSNSATATIYSSAATISNLAISDILGISAKVTWNAISGIAWYGLRYKEISSSSWILVTTGSSPSKILSSLTPNTTYEIQVRGYCSTNNVGNWSSSVLFTTNNQCGTPSSLLASNITASSAKLSWLSTGASFYSIRWKPISTSTWSASSTTTTLNKTIAGLLPNTTYEFQVKSNCGNSSSAFSASTSFTTASLKASLQSTSKTVPNELWIAYPNPTQQNIVIEYTSVENKLITFNVMDMSGRMLKKQQVEIGLGENQIPMDLSDLSKGVYFIQVNDDTSLLTVIRLVKE